MKTLVFSMLAMAAMVSCTSESDPIEDIDNGQPKEVKMTAGVIDVETTKAAVNPGDAFKASFFRVDGSVPSWAAVLTPKNVDIPASGVITFDAPEYYPTDGSNANFIGISPQVTASIEAGTVTTTITGDEDVMYAGKQSGSRLIADPLAMSFSHLLTQVKFVVKTDASAISDVAVTSIKIKDVNTVLAIQLADGKITSTTPISTIGTGAMTATKIGSSASDSYMIESNPTSLTFIVNATGYTQNQEVTISKDFKAGTAYTITLTFKDKEITGGASVSKWETDQAEGEVL